MRVLPTDLKGSFSQTRAFSQSIQMARRFRHPDTPNCLPTKTSNKESQISKPPQSPIQNFQFRIQICRRAKFKILNSKLQITERFNSKFSIQNSKLPPAI